MVRQAILMGRGAILWGGFIRASASPEAVSRRLSRARFLGSGTTENAELALVESDESAEESLLSAPLFGLSRTERDALLRSEV